MLNIPLDNEQYTAVKSHKGYYLCLAGAGSGKTRVLAARCVDLINSNIKEESILCITYTKKAKEEMENRIAAFLGRKSRVAVTTFHSLCYQYISSFRNNTKKIIIMDEDDRKSIIKNEIKKQGFKNIEAKSTSSFIGCVKNKMEYSEYGETLNQRFKKIKLYFDYQDICIDSNRLDFDQMAYEFLEFLKANKEVASSISEEYQYIMVDESQDMNRVQFEILEIISSTHNNLFLVGDQDQTIYEWRGSDTRLLYEFEENYQPTILPLVNNYRCDGYIINISNNLISKNAKRYPKILKATKESINKPIFKSFNTPYDEAIFVTNKIKEALENGVKPNEIKVLYREKKQALFLEGGLRNKGIKYEISSTSLISYKCIKTLINYIRFIILNDDESFLEIINNPTRGIGDKRINQIIVTASNNKISRFEACKLINDERLNNFVELIEGLRELIKVLPPQEFIKHLINKINYDKELEKDSNPKNAKLKVEAFIETIANYRLNSNNYEQEYLNLLEDLFLENRITDTNECVSLMTIHQAKGLEGKIVFLIGFRQKTTPGKAIKINDIEAERRIAFVAITRAKEQLYITYPNFYQESYSAGSQFIKEMK